MRADKYLGTRFPRFSRSRLQKLFEQGLVWREDEVLRKKDKLAEGEQISFTIPPPTPTALAPADIPLRILYEDEHLLAVDKAPGMVTHPGAGTQGDTLVHALLHHCPEEFKDVGGAERPGIVHRLDKETSGVIVVAKTSEAFAGLGQLFSERRLEKEYLALCIGRPRLESGRVDAPIGRHPVQRVKMAVVEHGRAALSDWLRLEAFGEAASLLRVRIHTGRTHQIRVHMAHIGHPLLGDTQYGYRPNRLPDIEPPRVMLHAHRLAFKHPVSADELEIIAEAPKDFSELQATLRAAANKE